MSAERYYYIENNYATDKLSVYRDKIVIERRISDVFCHRERSTVIVKTIPIDAITAVQLENDDETETCSLKFEVLEGSNNDYVIKAIACSEVKNMMLEIKAYIEHCNKNSVVSDELLRNNALAALGIKKDFENAKREILFDLIKKLSDC